MSAEAASRTIRSRAGIVWLVVVGVGATVLLVDVLVRGGATDLLLTAPWLLLIVWVVWAFLASPSLRADDHGVSVRNPFRSTTAPWAAVREISLRWQIELRLDGDRRVQVWAVQARRAPRRTGETAGSGREREVLDDLRALHAAASRGRGAAVRRRWNLDVLVPLAALVIWAAVAVAVTR